jgi:hypothetical protein
MVPASRQSNQHPTKTLGALEKLTDVQVGINLYGGDL